MKDSFLARKNGKKWIRIRYSIPDSVYGSGSVTLQKSSVSDRPWVLRGAGTVRYRKYLRKLRLESW